MKKLNEQTDSEFESNIELCNISSSDFDHNAHIRLAWISINKYGVDNALQRVPLHIQKLVRKFNAYDKYHATLTIAAIKAVYHFIQKSNSIKFNDFLDEFPRLTDNFKALIFTHYSKKRLFHPKAKNEYLSPDLLPFD